MLSASDVNVGRGSPGNIPAQKYLKTNENQMYTMEKTTCKATVHRPYMMDSRPVGPFWGVSLFIVHCL